MLEIQVDEITEDIADIEGDIIITRVDLTELEGDVDFLFDETVIQDERLFTLEQTTDLINTELDLIDDEFIAVDNELESEYRAGNSDNMPLYIKIYYSSCCFDQSSFLQVSKPQSLPWISELELWRRTEGVMGTAQ